MNLKETILYLSYGVVLTIIINSCYLLYEKNIYKEFMSELKFGYRIGYVDDNRTDCYQKIDLRQSISNYYNDSLLIYNSIKPQMIKKFGLKNYNEYMASKYEEEVGRARIIRWPEFKLFKFEMASYEKEIIDNLKYLHNIQDIDSARIYVNSGYRYKYLIQGIIVQIYEIDEDNWGHISKYEFVPNVVLTYEDFESTGSDLISHVLTFLTVDKFVNYDMDKPRFSLFSANERTPKLFYFEENWLQILPVNHEMLPTITYSQYLHKKHMRIKSEATTITLVAGSSYKYVIGWKKFVTTTLILSVISMSIQILVLFLFNKLRRGE